MQVMDQRQESLDNRAARLIHYVTLNIDRCPSIGKIINVLHRARSNCEVQ